MGERRVGTNNIFQSGYAITPIDGRNRHKVEPLAQYFSEFALDKYRVFVEIRYLEWLSKEGVVRKITSREIAILEKVWGEFSIEDLQRIRTIEKTTNHDLKAVEYWIREKIEKTSLKDLVEMIHFSLGSDDINNLAYTISLKDALSKIIYPELQALVKLLLEMTHDTKSLPILARTHGQIASVTTLGKELFIFGHRLVEELSNLKSIKLTGKINGDIGNWHSHFVVFPKIDWIDESKKFVKSLGLEPAIVSTQIEPYDSWIRLFDNLRHLNSILIGFCQDLWLYAALGIFMLKTVDREVGSSLMPHKVNPIYLEGAEGGLELANALLAFFSEKFAINRLQRDFSDSTTRRNIGFTLAHCLLGYQSVQEGLRRLSPNREVIEKEIDNHYEVLAEGIQSFLRVKGVEKPYELLKKFTRGKIVSRTEMTEFIKKLPINTADKKYLLGLTPMSYVGLAEKIVDRHFQQDMEVVKKFV